MPSLSKSFPAALPSPDFLCSFGTAFRTNTVALPGFPSNAPEPPHRDLQITRPCLRSFRLPDCPALSHQRRCNSRYMYTFALHPARKLPAPDCCCLRHGQSTRSDPVLCTAHPNQVIPRSHFSQTFAADSDGMPARFRECSPDIRPVPASS